MGELAGAVEGLGVHDRTAAGGASAGRGGYGHPERGFTAAHGRLKA